MCVRCEEQYNSNKVILLSSVMASFSVAKCVINNDDTDEELKPVTDKGIATIIRFCTIQNRPDLEEYLNSGPDVVLVTL